MQEQPIALAYNAQWETGMGSGIVAGLQKSLSIEPHLQAVIFAVCDQPYSETLGTPVLFGGHYFQELLSLTGEAGARHRYRHRPGS